MSAERMFYHPEEAAKLLGVTRGTFDRWITKRTNVYKFTSMIGRTRVLSRENLERYINGQKPVKDDFQKPVRESN